MKKAITIAIILISIFATAVVVVSLNCSWIYTPKWFPKTNRSKARSMQRILNTMALTFEQTDIPPPADSILILEEKIERWGTPVQYSYENSEAILRSAGRDQKLNTKDDITQKVRITSSLTLLGQRPFLKAKSDSQAGQD